MKTKVALLRGLGRESSHWDPEFIQLMQEQYDLILLDYPGCGPFNKEIFPASTEKLLTHLNQQLKNSEPVFLVAVSLGGMVALKWAEQNPEKFLGLVLINSSVSDLNPFYQRLKPQAIMTLIQATMQGSLERAEKYIVELVSNDSSKHANTIQRWVDVAKKRPIDLKNIFRQLKFAAGFRSPPAPLKVPLQLIAAEKDRLASVDCSRKIAAKYHAPLAVHATGGHDLVIDDAPWVSEQIQQFIKRRTIS